MAPDGRIFVVGGHGLVASPGYVDKQGASDSLFAYDPDTDTWEKDTNNGGSLQPMLTSRGEFGLALGKDGRLIAVGGYSGAQNDGGSTAEVECYDPVANTWEALPPLPQRQCCFASTSATDGRVYVLEGEVRSNTPTGSAAYGVDNVWAYDPPTGTWTQGAASPLKREDTLCARAADGKIYAYGGAIGSSTHSENLAYDPAANVWNSRTVMPRGVLMTQGVADLGGRIYAMGGGRVGSYGYFQSRSDVQCFDSDRSIEGTYTSPSKNIGNASKAIFGAITWDADVPEGTTLRFSTRTSMDGVTWSAWSAPYVTSGSSVTSPEGKYIQYRAEFSTSDPMKTARLDRVAIAFNCSPEPYRIYDVVTNKGQPDLQWRYWWDAESDPVVYQLQIDSSSAFDSPDLRSYAGMSGSGLYITTSVPRCDALPDGMYRWRLGAQDGYSSSAWLEAGLDIESTVPTVSVTAYPSTFAPGSANAGTTELICGREEATNLTLKILSGSTTIRTWSFTSSADTATVAWDGRNSTDALVADGTYTVQLEANDNHGNRSLPVTTEVKVRRGPRLGERVRLSSDASDPGAPLTLEVPVSGNASRVRAWVDGTPYELQDADHDGLYTGALELPEGRTTVDRIEAADGVSGALDVREAVTAEWGGSLGSSVWSQTSAADFATGSLSGLTASGLDALALSAAGWEPVGFTLAQGRYRAASCQVGSKLYVFGGTTSASVYTGNTEVIDLASGAGTQLATAPSTRHSAAAAPGPDGKIYVFGGLGGSTSGRTLEVYDPATNTWATRTALPVSRVGGFAFPWDGKILVVGGSGSGGPGCQLYDTATGVWTTKAIPPNQIGSDSAAVQHGGKVYVFGGSATKVQVYDPASDSWSVKRDLHLRWFGAKAAVCGDRILLAGTGYGFASENAAFWYDPATDTYEACPTTTDRRYLGAVGSWNGTVYLVGGSASPASTILATGERFSPTSVGSYVSPVRDVGMSVRWGRIGWSALLPQGTSLAISTRTSWDGATWSEWSQPCEPGDEITSPDGRHVQYRVEAATTDVPRTPTVGDVTLSWIDPNAGPPSAPVPQQPPDDAVSYVADPVLSWLNAAGGGLTRTYEVELDRSPAFDSPALRARSLVPESPGASMMPVASTSPLAEGRWYWRVRATSERGAGEWSGTSAFDVLTRANLAVDSIAIPEGIEAGDAATITATISNTGAPAAGIRVRFFDGDPSAGAAQIGDDALIASLSREEIAAVSAVLDTSGGAGVRDIRVLVDPDERITESDENDNDRAAGLPVAPNGMAVTAALDFDTYQPSELVTATVSVTNQGLRARDAVCVVEVVDADGVLAEAVRSQPLTPAGSESATLTAVWDSDGFYVGEYAVRVRVTDAGRTLASASEPFSLAAAVALDARVTVGRLQYSANQTVSLQSRVTNRTPATTMSDLTVVTEVTSPDGAALLHEEATVPQLLTGELRTYANSLETDDRAPGTYRVTERVMSSEDATLATSESSFEVLPSALTGAGLSGALTAAPATVHQGEDVTLGWGVTNSGNSDLADLPTAVVLADPETGSTIATLPAEVDLPKGADASATTTFDTADMPLVTGHVGSRVLAVLRAHVGGRWLTLGHANFTVAPIRVSVSSTPDAPAYDCGQPVALTASASNDTTGFALAGLTLRCELVSPTGETLLSETTTTASLAFGEQASAHFAWNTARSAPGTYRLRTDALYEGLVVASHESTFTVLSTAHTGTGLSGSLDAPATLSQGSPLLVGLHATNAGNDDIAALPLTLALHDAATGECLRTYPATAALPRDATYASSILIPAEDILELSALGERTFELRLAATLPTGVKPLASATTRTEAAATVDITKHTGAIPRVLVWAETDANASLASDALADIACVSKVVRDRAAFVSEMRTGIYDTYVLLDCQLPIVAHLDEELVERVNAGATLIASRRANACDLRRERLFGVRYAGALPCTTHTVTLDESPITPAGTLTATGTMQCLIPTTASVVGRTGTYPAVTTNTYGRGTAVLYAFDLAQTSGIAPDELLATAIAGAPSRADHADALDVVAVQVTLTNPGAPMRAHVTEALSGATPIAALGAQVGAGGTLRATYDFGAGETRTFTYLARLPEGRSISATTTVLAEVGAEVRDAGEMTATFTARADFDALCANALAAADALPEGSGCSRKAIARVERELAGLRAHPPDLRCEYEDAIFGLVRAIADLEHVDADTTDARLAIDEVLAYCEAGWSL